MENENMPEANIEQEAPAPGAGLAPEAALAPAKKPVKKKPDDDGVVAMKAEMAKMKKSLVALEDERDEAVAETEVAGDRIKMLEQSVLGDIGNPMPEDLPKGKKARAAAIGKVKEDTVAHARRLDRSKPYGEILVPWQGAHYSQLSKGGRHYFDASGIEITTLRAADQQITDPGLADAQAKARSEAVNLAAWAEGVEDYADADVYRAIRDRCFTSVSSVHDAIDVLIKHRITSEEKQKRSRAPSE